MGDFRPFSRLRFCPFRGCQRRVVIIYGRIFTDVMPLYLIAEFNGNTIGIKRINRMNEYM